LKAVIAVIVSLMGQCYKINIFSHKQMISLITSLLCVFVCRGWTGLVVTGNANGLSTDDQSQVSTSDGCC